MPGMPQGAALLVAVAVVDLVFFAHACSLIGWKAALKMFLIGILGAFLFEEFVGLQSGLCYFTDAMGPRIDKASGGVKALSILPLAMFGLMGVSFIIGNYAGTMAIIELYAMGATFAIALVKWVDWLRST